MLKLVILVLQLNLLDKEELFERNRMLIIFYRQENVVLMQSS